MNKHLKRFLTGLRFFFVFPLDALIAWPLALLIHAAFGTKGTLKWEYEVLNVFVDANSWLFKKFGDKVGAFTLGHSVVWMTVPHIQTVVHELEHVEQIEGNGIYGFFLFLVLLPVCWWLGLILWILTPPGCYVAAGLRGVLAGKNFYWDNNFEEAANNVESKA